MAKSTKIGFSFNKIKTEQFAIIEDAYKEGKEIEVAFDLNYGIDHNNRALALFPKFSYIQGKSAFLIIGISFEFIVKPEAYKDFVNSKTKQIIVPINFMSHLATITIGATRGVLHAKTENTAFNHLILPSINLTEIIKEDIVFQLPLSTQ